MASRDRKPFVCLPVAGQSFWQPGEPDSRRTALREAAYIRRTKFVKGELVHDFACRAEDLFMLAPIIPAEAPAWVHRPFLRWHFADEAVEDASPKGAVRAWHVCGDLPLGVSRGQWADQAEQIVREVLPSMAVAEICGHIPNDHPPHLHILVAARVPGARRYGRLISGLGDILQNNLRERWLEWCCADQQTRTRLKVAA
jgi:hypothetical protein